ncbi:hypothetical protein PBRA_002761 [Plasmodiophora brassicae]|uniref:C2H2-type domain-containing protein n=1 Tax=Plasmodiophora brassicae TaxID=37360 RepID=A0A0G4J5Z8_PLABS|nr:hypothetical protein PBRA_002761 [Plasmodiophora brassicae]
MLMSRGSGEIFVSSKCPAMVKDRFTCSECDKRCQTKQALISHMKTHKVEEEYQANPQPDEQRVDGPSSKRQRYSFERKVDIIKEVLDTQRPSSGEKRSRALAVQLVSDDTGIPATTIARWMKNEDQLRDRVASSADRAKKSSYNRCWLKDLRHLEEVLAREIRKERAKGGSGLTVKGRKISKNWSLSMARQIRRRPNIVNPNNAKEIKLSYGWYYHGFLPRHDFSIRRGNNRKKIDAVAYKPIVYEFHQLLAKRNSSRSVFPHSMFNFDEVPLPFVNDGDRRTVDDVGTKRVWIRQPGAGDEKRQATLFLCIGADCEVQPRPHVIFRGKGTQILRSDEPNQWDSRVSVHFQENGWVDTKTAVNIAKVMQQDPAFVNPDENRTFLCDNLQSHKAPEFVDSMKSLGEIVLFPPNVTDLLQPVDAGAGRMMKYLIASRLDAQMDDDAAFSSKWLGGKFTASERRVLITNWVGEAWERLCQAGYIHKYFEKTGCLLGTVGADPGRIKIQGLDEYRFIPNVPFIINVDDGTDSDSSDSGEFSEGTYKAADPSSSDEDAPILSYEPGQNRFREGDYVEVFDSDGQPLLTGSVTAPRTSLHGQPVPDGHIVVVIARLHTTSCLGVDHFGEPVGVGGYTAVPVNRAFLCCDK